MAVHVTRAGVALTVGIIVLTGLIIGGLFWVKETGEQARREEAIAIAEQNLEAASDGEVALNDGVASEEEAEQGAGTATEEAADSQAPVSTTIPQGSTVNELPQTGPSDGLFVILLGGAVFVGVSYYQSRRAIRETL